MGETRIGGMGIKMGDLFGSGRIGDIEDKTAPIEIADIGPIRLLWIDIGVVRSKT